MLFQMWKISLTIVLKHENGEKGIKLFVDIIIDDRVWLSNTSKKYHLETSYYKTRIDVSVFYG